MLIFHEKNAFFLTDFRKIFENPENFENHDFSKFSVIDPKKSDFFMKNQRQMVEISFVSV